MRVGTLVRRLVYVVEGGLPADSIRRRFPPEAWLAVTDDTNQVIGFIQAGDLPTDSHEPARKSARQYPQVEASDTLETVHSLMQEQGWDLVQVRDSAGDLALLTRWELENLLDELSRRIQNDIDRHATRLTQTVDELRKEIVGRHRVERMLRIQNRLSADLGAAEDVSAVLHHLVQAVAELEGVDAAAAYDRDPVLGDVVLRHSKGLSDRYLAACSRFAGDSEMVRQLMEGRPIYRAVQKSPIGDVLEREGFCSSAVLPIWAAGQVVAGLGLASRSLIEIPANQRQTLESMVDRAGMAIVRLRGEERLRQARDELERRVLERTAELAQLNEALRHEVEERRHAEVALRASRQEFADLLQSLDHVVWAAKPETNELIYINDAVQRIYGRPPRDFIEDSDLWHKVIHPDDHPRVVAAADLLKSTGRCEYEYRILRPDGGVRWVRDSVRVIGDVEGNPLRLTGVVSDVTELKRAEEAARQQQMDLSHVSRLATMGELAAGIAHEINQPLTSIVNFSRGCIRRIRGDAAPHEQVLEILEQIALQAERAGDIIRGLRRFLRKQETQRTNVDVCGVIRDALALSEGEIRKHRVALSVSLPEDLPAVWGDAIQIEQVVLNLLWNGLEAMRSLNPAGRQLTVAASAMASGGVLVTVEDSGLGMSREMLERAFEPFYTTKPSALGLGLAISKSIIEAHGGSIWLSSDASRGTIVSFTLPCGRTGDRHV